MRTTSTHGGATWRVLVAAVAALIALTGLSLGSGPRDRDAGGGHTRPAPAEPSAQRQASSDVPLQVPPSSEPSHAGGRLPSAREQATDPCAVIPVDFRVAPYRRGSGQAPTREPRTGDEHQLPCTPAIAAGEPTE